MGFKERLLGSEKKEFVAAVNLRCNRGKSKVFTGNSAEAARSQAETFQTQHQNGRNRGTCGIPGCPGDIVGPEQVKRQ